jgi:hypothetical protein
MFILQIFFRWIGRTEGDVWSTQGIECESTSRFTEALADQTADIFSKIRYIKFSVAYPHYKDRNPRQHKSEAG